MPDTDVASPTMETWAGVQVTEGTRRIPVIGQIRSTTTARTVARVARDGDSLILIDYPCAIAVTSSHSVSVSFDETAVQSMPPITVKFMRDAEGRMAAGPWIGGWGHIDVDRDAVDGIHARVDTPVCSGWLDVASRTESIARGELDVTGLHGDIAIDIHRDIIATSNACLSLVDRHTDESVSGAFAWVPVPADATCASLLLAPWPAVLSSSTGASP